MAMLVSYKGNVIATVTDTEKTLNTSGKWMEDDVVIGPGYTATVTGSGSSSVYVAYKGTDYDTAGTFSFKSGDNLFIWVNYGDTNNIKIDGVTVVSIMGTASYTYSLPSNDISISLFKSRGVSSITITSSSSSSISLQSKTNIDPTTSSQTITADSGYDGLSSVQINAMPSGTEGTPTATKGAVSNHSVSVTPSVTNVAGYISGGSHTGTAVTVSASELDSGTKAISSNGTGIDVVGYAAVDVAVPMDAGEYTLENISPSQSITTNGTVSSYATGGMISSYTERIQEGEWYLVTYDGDEYVLQCYLANTGEIVLGDIRVATTNTTLTYLSTPFIVEYNSTVPVYFLAARNTNTHTLKIDKFVWIAGGATVGTKTITTNGTYDPADDDLDLYSGVTVNVPSGGSTLTTKTITANGTYNASSDNADGYSSVTVNVPTYKTGTVSFSTTYNSTGNREIVSISTIGFTPKYFYLIIRDKSVVSGKRYAVLRASFETLHDNTYLRTTTRYSDTSNSLNASNSASSWTTQTNYYLYMDGSKVYLRTTNSFIIFTGTSYDWIAIA